MDGYFELFLQVTTRQERMKLLADWDGGRTKPRIRVKMGRRVVVDDAMRADVAAFKRDFLREFAFGYRPHGVREHDDISDLLTL